MESVPAGAHQQRGFTGVAEPRFRSAAFTPPPHACLAAPISHPPRAPTQWADWLDARVEIPGAVGPQLRAALNSDGMIHGMPRASVLRALGVQ